MTQRRMSLRVAVGLAALLAVMLVFTRVAPGVELAGPLLVGADIG